MIENELWAKISVTDPVYHTITFIPCHFCLHLLVKLNFGFNTSSKCLKNLLGSGNEMLYFQPQSIWKFSKPTIINPSLMCEAGQSWGPHPVSLTRISIRFALKNVHHIQLFNKRVHLPKLPPEASLSKPFFVAVLWLLYFCIPFFSQSQHLKKVVRMPLHLHFDSMMAPTVTATCSSSSRSLCSFCVLLAFCIDVLHMSTFNQHRMENIGGKLCLPWVDYFLLLFPSIISIYIVFIL